MPLPIIVLLVLAALLVRGRMADALGSLAHAEAFLWMRDVACVLIASALACLAIEEWNSQAQSVAFLYARHEFLIVLLVMSICYLLAFRGGHLMVVASVAAAVIGAVEHYVWSFRGTPLIPSDMSLSTLETAGAVAGGYDLAPDETVLATIGYALLAVAISLLVKRPKGQGGPWLVSSAARKVIGAFRSPKHEKGTVAGVEEEASGKATESEEATGENASPTPLPATGGKTEEVSDADDASTDTDAITSDGETAEPAEGAETSTAEDEDTDVIASVDVQDDEDELVTIVDEDDADVADGEGDDGIESPRTAFASMDTDELVVIHDDDTGRLGTAVPEEEQDEKTVGDTPENEEDAAGQSDLDADAEADGDTAKDDDSHDTERTNPYARKRRGAKHLGRHGGKVRAKRPLPRFVGGVASLVSPALTIALGYAVVTASMSVTAIDYKEQFPDMVVDWWQITSSYRKQGTLPTFALLMQEAQLEAPDGWDEDEAEEEYAALVQAYDDMLAEEGREPVTEAPDPSELPDIVGIMNESFCDMSIYDRMEFPDEVAPRFMRTDAPGGIVESGRMRVSVFGGTTANSEYEFLTGDCLIGFGGGIVPYAQYNLSQAPSLARQLSGYGYATYAMHPCDPRNWDRNSRYPELGFDEFISEGDFEEAGLTEQFHDVISDKMCYEMASRVLADREDTGEPTFIWDVTVQNHGGYDKDDIPEDMLVDWDLGKLSRGTAKEVREFMSCAEESTRATLEFLEELEERERPTVVFFYGDHQPGCNGAIAKELYDDINESSTAALQYQTCYFVWENAAMRRLEAGEDADAEDADEARERDEETEVAIRPRDEMSTNMLAASLMERLGLPLTDFQKALLAIRRDARSTCLMGYVRADDFHWVLMNEKNLAEPLRQVRDLDWLLVDRYLV